ncbi:MAG: T9SS type A sorting domain-containing protein [Chitinophagaceae bacterium]
MKRKDTLFKIRKRGGLAIRLLCLLAVMQLLGSKVMAQAKKRTYAPVQQFQGTGVLGVIAPGTANSPQLAADGNPATDDTLNVPLSVNIGSIVNSSARQFLQFTTDGTSGGAVRTISAGTPITVKLGLPKSLVGLLTNITIQPFTNLTNTLGTWSATAAGSAFNVNSLVNLLNGTGSVEVTVTPTANCNGVWVDLSSVLSLGLSMNIYHAYVLDNATPPLACNQAIDVLSGIKGNSTADLASATGTVTNPWNAIDADATYTTFANLQSGALVASSVYETVIFNQPGKAGDSVRLVLEDPGAGLLDLSLLANLSIQAYNGTTAVGAAINTSSSLLSLRLLSGSSTKYIFSAPINGVFDRVQLSLGGVVAALYNLRVYDVSRVIPKPTVTGTAAIVAKDTVKAYVGANVTITATPHDATDGVNWYNATNTLITSSPTGASQISLNNITAANSGIYVAVTTRNGCTETSARDTIHVKVLAAALSPVSGALPAGNRNSAYSQTLSLTGDLDLAPFTYHITSGSLPTGLTLSTSGVITGTPTTMGTSNFSVQALDSNSTVAASASYSLAINAALPITLLNFNANKDNSGSNVVLTWNTADAVNFSHFEIQRSSDGIRFNTIGTVAYNGSSYTFTDNAAFKGINHYRLKMVDIDGQFENSIIRSVILGRSSAIEIFPNPVNTIITISTGNQLQGKVTVQVTDLAGRVLKQEQKSATVGSTIAVDASRLLNGIYMLNVITEGGQRIFSGQVLVRH